MLNKKHTNEIVVQIDKVDIRIELAIIFKVIKFIISKELILSKLKMNN